MTHPIGFSTGALAKGDFRRGLDLQRNTCATAVELSALRLSELRPLIEAKDKLDLSPYEYVSFHAPSHFSAEEEETVVAALHELKELNWPIVLHPDTVHDFSLWTSLGSQLLIENMDRRKPARTYRELAEVFEQVPDARFCFDIAHARAIDPSMGVAATLLQQFSDKLAEVHMSELDAHYRHRPLSRPAIQIYQRLASLIPTEVPVIIEAVVSENQIEPELRSVIEVFNCRAQESKEQAKLASG